MRFYAARHLCRSHVITVTATFRAREKGHQWTTEGGLEAGDAAVAHAGRDHLQYHYQRMRTWPTVDHSGGLDAGVAAVAHQPGRDHSAELALGVSSECHHQRMRERQQRVELSVS